MILGNFWSDRDPEVEALEVASWLRVLGSMGADEILDGWNAYQANGPKSEKGRLLKPTAHDIRTRALDTRKQAYGFKAGPKSFIDKPPREEPPRATVSPEVAERICQEAGFTPEHAALVKRFPTAQTRQTIEDRRSFIAETVKQPITQPERDALHKARLTSPISVAALAEAQRTATRDTPEPDSMERLPKNPDLDGEDPADAPRGGVDSHPAGKGQEPGGSPSQTADNGGGHEP